MARRAVARRRKQGAVRQLPSGRWQARYRDDDGRLRPAPVTFDTKLDASAWLDGDASNEVEEQRADPTLREFAATWLGQRIVNGRPLKPRTRAEYQTLLDAHILPTLGELRLSRITTTKVATWHASLDPTKPTRRAHAYSLLRAIMRTAVMYDLIAASPCKVEGAGSSKTRHQARPATAEELDVIVRAMPPRYRAMVLLAAWGGLRFGELTELRRQDIDGGVVRVARGVVRVGGGFLVGDPKSDAGRRAVSLPRELVPVLEQHLAQHVGAEPDALLFPAQHGGHMAPSTLYKVWYPAREKAGRPDLRFHDLRHTGLTLFAATGATLAEIQQRGGHSTLAAAMRYQHAADDRAAALNDRLSELYSVHAARVAESATESTEKSTA